MFDGLSRFTDGLGKSVLFVMMAPLSAVIHLDEMAQSSAGAEELLFGIVTLDFDGEGLGHRPQCARKA
jgi:hypothetical protein